jgi:hypothetical protein
MVKIGPGVTLVAPFQQKHQEFIVDLPELMAEFPGVWLQLLAGQKAGDIVKDDKISQLKEADRVTPLEIIAADAQTVVNLHGGGKKHATAGYVKRKYAVRLPDGTFSSVYYLVRASDLVGKKMQVMTLAPGAKRLVVKELSKVKVVDLRVTDKEWARMKEIGTPEHMRDVLANTFPDQLENLRTPPVADGKRTRRKPKIFGSEPNSSVTPGLKKDVKGGNEVKCKPKGGAAEPGLLHQNEQPRVSDR